MSGESPTLREMLAGLDRVGLRMVTRNPKENVIFSPLSALLSTGCVTFLCDPEDSEKLRKWFGIDPSVSDGDLADGLKWLGDTFRQDSRNGMYWELIAQETVCIPERYLEFVKDRIGVGVLQADFPSPAVEIINKNVAEVTHGKITEVIDARTCCRRVLCNAVYFKGYWERAFTLNNWYRWRLPDRSYSEQMVGATSTFKYAANRTYHYVAIPYEDSKEMEIFMMKNSSKLPVNLTADEMAELRAKATPKDMTLFMPTWEQGPRNTGFKDVLAEDGIVIPEMSEMLLDQTAMIAVTESYTEVAAVSMCFMGDSCVRPRIPWFPFIVDRPFIYTIRSGRVTEFMGYLYEPHPGTGYDEGRPGTCQVA